MSDHDQPIAALIAALSDLLDAARDAAPCHMERAIKDAESALRAVPPKIDGKELYAEGLMVGIQLGKRLDGPVDNQPDDGVHTGDDDLLDALTSARTALESIAEDDDVDATEAVADALESLTLADTLRVEQLRAVPPQFDQEELETRGGNRGSAEVSSPPQRAIGDSSTLPSGSDLIARERARQISVEGWTPEHDDKHTRGELSAAACCYVFHVGGSMMGLRSSGVPRAWPWEPSWWKPAGYPILNLVKAGALIAAEIDRLQRQGECNGTTGHRTGLSGSASGVDGVEASAGGDDAQERAGRGIDGALPPTGQGSLRSDQERYALNLDDRAIGAVPPQPERHRCSGCGHRWDGDAGLELCGDCWRKAQPVVHEAVSREHYLPVRAVPPRPPVSPEDLSVGGEDARSEQGSATRAEARTQASDAGVGGTASVPEVSAQERSPHDPRGPVDDRQGVPVLRGTLGAVPPQQEPEIAEQLEHAADVNEAACWRQQQLGTNTSCLTLIAPAEDCVCDSCRSVKIMRLAASALRAVRSPQRQDRHDQDSETRGGSVPSVGHGDLPHRKTGDSSAPVPEEK